MGSEKMQSLLAQTLLGDHEGKGAWAAVSALRLDGNREVFEQSRPPYKREDFAKLG